MAAQETFCHVIEEDKDKDKKEDKDKNFCHIHEEDKKERLRRRRGDLQKFKIFGPLRKEYDDACAEFNLTQNQRIRVVLDRKAEEEADKMDFFDDLCVVNGKTTTVNEKTTTAKQFPWLIAVLDLSGDDPRVCSTNIRVRDVDVEPLAYALLANPGVVSLDLRYNWISNDGAAALAWFIKRTKTLREINLMGNDIGADGGVAIADAITANVTLVRVRINGNPLGVKGGVAFARTVKANRRLVSLDLGDTAQKTDSVIALAEALRGNKTLKAINMNNPILFSLQEETTVHLAKMLRVNKGLQELHLQKHNIKCFGADWLADNLAHNTTLKLLDLSNNLIAEDGVHSLSVHLLQKDTPLEMLKLSGNKLRDDSGFHLANALLKNHHLRMLSVARNDISTAGLLSLVAGLKQNCRLRTLHVWGNNIDSVAAAAFQELLDCERIKPEDIDIRPYSVDGVMSVAQVSKGVNLDYYWTPYYGDRSPGMRKTRAVEGGVVVPA